MLRSSFLVHFLYCNSWFLYWKLVENTFFALNAFLRFLCRQHFWLRHYFTFIGFFMLHMLLNGWHYYVVPQRLPKPNLQISFSCKGKSIIVTENLYFRPILIIFLLLIKFVLSLNYREHNCSYKSLSFYINQGPITAAKECIVFNIVNTWHLNLEQHLHLHANIPSRGHQNITPHLFLRNES